MLQLGGMLGGRFHATGAALNVAAVFLLVGLSAHAMPVAAQPTRPAGIPATIAAPNPNPSGAVPQQGPRRFLGPIGRLLPGGRVAPGELPRELEAVKPPPAPPAPRLSRPFQLATRGQVVDSEKGRLARIDEARIAWQGLSLRRPDVARNVETVLEGVNLVVEHNRPTPVQLDAMRRVGKAIMPTAGLESELYFDWLLGGMPLKRPMDLEAAHRAYGDVDWETAQAMFQGDVQTIRGAIDKGVVIRAEPRETPVDDSGRPPIFRRATQREIDDAVELLNGQLGNARTAFARTQFRLDLHPGAQKDRVMLTGLAASAGVVATGVSAPPSPWSAVDGNRGCCRVRRFAGHASSND